MPTSSSNTDLPEISYMPSFVRLNLEKVCYYFSLAVPV